MSRKTGGFASCFRLGQVVLQRGQRLGRCARSGAGGARDDPGLTHDAVPWADNLSLALARRSHDLEALEQGVLFPV